MLGPPIYGLGPTNGRIGPWGWVAKMGVLQEISGEMGQIPETALHEATALHLAPTPHPTPWGGSSTPRRMLGTPIYGLGPTNGRIGPWGWVAKMGVLQEISGKMGQIPYHGQYQGFPYQTISYQFTIVKRYCTGQYTKS